MHQCCVIFIQWRLLSPPGLSRICKSELCKNPPDDLEELLLSYNKTLIAVLDKHAPVKTRTIVMRPQVPRYTDEIRQAKGERRNAERRWRLSKLDSDLAVFKVKRNAVNNLMNKARQAFYTKLIEDNSCNQRKLFRASKSLFNQSHGRWVTSESARPHFCKRSWKVFYVKDWYNPETNRCWYYRFICLCIHYCWWLQSIYSIVICIQDPVCQQC